MIFALNYRYDTPYALYTLEYTIHFYSDIRLPFPRYLDGIYQLVRTDPRP